MDNQTATNMSGTFTKVPLVRVRAWEFRNLSKEYEYSFKNNKTEIIEKYQEGVLVNIEFIQV